MNLNTPHPMAAQEHCSHNPTSLGAPETSAETPLLLGPVQRLSISAQETKVTKNLHLDNNTH